ncbi:TetR/AcrR family transcriptional regulator [Cohnella sp. WQ 127256]|uniref:TetR/AcrR family transcriptional regulator n=1 Tax=Cohnella sp. WQ 127256 TaxID=2938790 RepID=UPI0021178DA0|nr:TetR-like C-terminal domain-containing protein [Cohnella sp. WQ 127256]
MNHSTTRTDPRIVRTRRLLRDALVELLEEMDVEKISVNRLAERATINRVTFYLHYRDIPDMMDKMAGDMIEDISSILYAPDSKLCNDKEIEWPLLVKLLEHIAEHSRFYKVILATNRTTVFTDRLLKLLMKLITENMERTSDAQLDELGIKREITIWYGSSALIGTIVTWLRKEMPYTPLFMAKQISLMRHYFHKES